MVQQNRRKVLYKRMGISSIFISIICICLLLPPLILYNYNRCTTSFFHFNIDYRLGDEDVEDTIIREPYYKLLKMYDKHPSWKFTIECQAAMIEKIYSDSDYENIADLTTELVEREQMELICGFQYSQLFYMYPQDVADLNLRYARETLKKHDLFSDRSRCFLFQEGQYGYGLATLLNKPSAKGIDTVLISHQQIRAFQKSSYRGEDSPVYELENTETDKSIYLLEYDYMPKWEAGYMHSWKFLLDAELGFEDSEADEEFVVDDNKIAAYEQQMLILELEGNEFMTCSEWVEHCIDYGAVRELDYYIPETNWATTRYNSSYIWAANNGDSTDDGEMLANNYRCRQIIYSTKKVYEKYKGLINQGNITLIEDKFEHAELLWLQATVTDSTGIGPDPGERITAEGNVLDAEKRCAEILQIIADIVPEMNVSKIQVDLRTGAIYNNTNDFISLINVTNPNLDDDDLPVDVDFDIWGGDQDDPIYRVSRVTYNSSDWDNETYDLYRLDVTFIGTHDWADDDIQKISIRFEDAGDASSMREIIYSPSLLENETKRLWRYNYIYDPLYIFLPLSNGLIFIPDEYTGEYGTAIVKNVTQRHTSWLWEYYFIEILETEGLHMDAHHQFYIMEDVSIDKALRFANRINIYPHWIVSKNVSLIQGNEVYDMYAQMENKQAEDEGSGEWW